MHAPAMDSRLAASSSSLRANGVRNGQAPSPRLGGFAHVSQRVLNDLFHRDVAFHESVREFVLNMMTRGTARALCHVGLDLVPNSGAANLRITMTGTVNMDDAVSTTGPVRIYSSSRTAVKGFKDVFFDVKGFRLAPSKAFCRTSIDIHDIDARRRLIERIAWRRAGRTQGQAEQAAARRTAKRAEAQIEAEAGKPLVELQEEYVEGVYQPLKKHRALPDARFSTTNEHLQVRVQLREPLKGSLTELGAPPTPRYDVAVCLSDAFANETCRCALGGRTIADRHFAEFMQILIGTTPRQLWVHERSDPWNVTLSKESPVVFAFRDGLMSIQLLIDHASRGDRQLNRPLMVSAKYTLEATSDGPHLVRAGSLEVAFPDAVEGGIDSTDAEFRQFLHTKFSGVLMDEIYFDGLIPPEGGSWGKLRRLQLTQFSVSHGWLAIGYDLTNKSATRPSRTARK